MSFLKLGSVVVLLFAWAAVCGSASPVPKDIPPASVVIVDGLWTLLGGPKPPAFVNTSFHAACSKNGFTFIRVAGTAYWPKDLALYDNNKTAYVTALEQLYQAASVNGCRILLSVFWNWFAVPDLVGEHLGDAMRNQSSVTRAWMMDYIFTVMSVASQYPEAVAGWELGNELNLLADLDMDTINPSIAPSLGTPTHRTKADNFSSADMVNFESWLAEQFVAQAVAANLPTLTSTGHSIPRSDAWHLYQSYYQPQRDWTKDTEDEFKQMLQWTSSCCDLASVHFYPGSGDRFGVKDPNSTYPLRVAFNALNGTHQTLYVGEYGNENPGPRSFSMSVLQLQSTIGIRLSTIWVWEFYQFSASSMAPFSIGTGKDDNNIRTAIQTVNTAWMAKP